MSEVRAQEKAKVAQNAAEVEAERARIAAELAEIEEEERLEAEAAAKAAKEAEKAKEPSSPAPASSSSSSEGKPSKSSKSTKAKTGDADPKNGDATPSRTSPTPSSSEDDPKADTKDKKEKKKQKPAEWPQEAETKPKEDKRRSEKPPKSNSSSSKDTSEPVSPKTHHDAHDKKDKEKEKSKSKEGASSRSSEPSEGPKSPKVSRSAKTESSEPKADKSDKSDKTDKIDAKSDSKGDVKSDKASKAEKTAKSPKAERPSESPSEKDKEKDKMKQKQKSKDKLTDKKDSSKEDRPRKQKSDSDLKKSDGASSSSASTDTQASSSTSPEPLKKDSNPSLSAAATTTMTKSPPAPRTLNRVESVLKIPVLDLSNRRIAELPGDIGQCTYLTKLYLTKNQLSNVSALSSLSELQVLTLSHNALTAFPIELSNEHSKLKDVALADNRISGIPSASISLKFPLLTKLDLLGNKFSEIPSAITDLPTLTSLNMAWNRVTSVPSTISKLPSLTNLILHHNNIKKIGSGICQLLKLTTLDLHENVLSAIPESMQELGALTKLDISHNQLKEWPATFNEHSQLSSLVKLDLSHNQIAGDIPADSFPEVEGTALPWIALEELYLNNNRITSLPGGLYKTLTSLAVLDVRSNAISELSEDIENLMGLQTLELGANKITTLPSNLGNLTNIQVLSLYRNQVSELPDISYLCYLQYLNVGHNQLSEISLLGLASLEELFISGNPIKALPDSMAEYCPNLKLLFASNMGLKKLPEGFGGLTQLEQIDFSFNKISELTAEMGELESLRWMSFSHNRLETSKEREVLKTPGVGPWDCIEFWQNYPSLHLADFSYNKLKHVPKGLETKFDECEVILQGNPLTESSATKSMHLTPQLGKRFQVGWAEMLGRRPTMEDHFLWQGALDGDTHMDLFAVFDGHAAREAAKFCAEQLPAVLVAQLAEEHIKSSKPKSLNSEVLFTKVFKTVNAALEKHLASLRDSSVKHCGTTAVVVLIIGDVMQIANVGDSRAVLNSGERCTIDDKPRSEVDRIRATLGGFVTGDGAGRINEVLAVSRSLGDFYMHPWVICDPHVYTKTLTKEDKYIILACDGIWDEIEDADAISIVDPIIQEGDLSRAASTLRDMAYSAGSDDNISVMIIKLSNK